MCITVPDKIVESLISLPVSPITNYTVSARSVLAVLLPLSYFERCNSADLAVGTKGRRGVVTQGLLSETIVSSLISQCTELSCNVLYLLP